MKQIVKIEDSPLWKSASRITNAAYTKLDGFGDDEKWFTPSRLRQHASSLTDEVAMAAGSLDPRDVQHFLGHARKDLFGIKSVYKMAHDNKLIEIDPEQMVLIDELVRKIDDRLASVPAELKEYWASIEPPEKKK